jgi:hypothetical protein
VIAVAIAVLAIGVVALIVAALSDAPQPRHRLDGDLVQERWDRRRTDRWT